MMTDIGELFRIKYFLVVGFFPPETVLETAQVHGSVPVAHQYCRLLVGKFAFSIDERLRGELVRPVQTVRVDAGMLQVLLRVANVIQVFHAAGDVDVSEILVDVRDRVVSFGCLHDDVIGAPRAVRREQKRGCLEGAVHGAQDERVYGSQAPVVS